MIVRDASAGAAGLLLLLLLLKCRMSMDKTSSTVGHRPSIYSHCEIAGVGAMSHVRGRFSRMIKGRSRGDEEDARTIGSDDL